MAAILYCSASLLGQTVGSTDQAPPTTNAPQESSDGQQGPPAQPADPGWQYGGFADIGYLRDFNYPLNHLFRSRGTTFHVNEVDLNMAAFYFKKTPVQSSRWGAELTLQGGKDSQVFGFSATARNLAGGVNGVLQNGAAIEDLAAKTGLSLQTIRRRLALADLGGEVVLAATRDGTLTHACMGDPFVNRTILNQPDHFNSIPFRNINFNQMNWVSEENGLTRRMAEQLARHSTHVPKAAARITYDG
jgi:hypothetical protein